MMRGLITELDFDLVDQAFPGIVRYYLELEDKPRTFLELFWAYTHRACGCVDPRTATSPAAARVVSR
jgi:hypothetical protein